MLWGDFYRSGVYTGYGDIQEGERADKVNERWHDTDAQLRYLEVLRRDNRLRSMTRKEIINESISRDTRQARK